MKNIAIVLAAGRGNRLRPLTDTVPKCMVPCPRGIPLLHRTAEKLYQVAATDLIVGVGFQKQAVSVPEFPGLAVHRVENDAWETTNNIHTLKLCVEYLKEQRLEFDNLFLIEGDVYLGDHVLQRLLLEPNSAVAVLPASYTKRGSCVAVDDLGYVKLLADNREWNDPSVFKVANVYKLTNADFFAVGDQLPYHDRSDYYEVMIGKLIGKVRLKAVLDGHCREIDNSYDWFALSDSLQLNYDDVRANWGGMWRRSAHDHFFLANPYYPTAFIRDRLKHALDTLISSYPSSRTRINQMLRACCNVDPSFPLYAVNGASEAIRLLQQHFNAIGVSFHLHFSPTFGEYGRFRLSAGPQADGTIVVSPNNPTAQRIDRPELTALLRRYRYVVLDLSLNTEKDTDYLNLMKDCPNLIVVKSLSKLMGVPGMRIGYCALSDECISGFEQSLPIWNVNSIAEGFLELHLDSLSDYERSLAAWSKEAQWLREQIGSLLPAADLSASDAFITLTTDLELARPLYDHYGVFVADVTAKFHDGRHHTRCGIRARRDNEYLVYALSSMLGQESGRRAGEPAPAAAARA